MDFTGTWHIYEMEIRDEDYFNNVKASVGKLLTSHTLRRIQELYLRIISILTELYLTLLH